MNTSNARPGDKRLASPRSPRDILQAVGNTPQKLLAAGKALASKAANGARKLLRGEGSSHAIGLKELFECSSHELRVILDKGIASKRGEWVLYYQVLPCTSCGN
jgi:hypothetical protein